MKSEISPLPLHGASAGAATLAASAETSSLSATATDNNGSNNNVGASLSLDGGGRIGGGGGGAGDNANGTADNSQVSNASPSITTNSNSMSTVNNTISAAADSSDNQPSPPQTQPQPQQQAQQQQQQATQQQQLGMADVQGNNNTASHHSYGAHNMYASASTTTTMGGVVPDMFNRSGIYSGSASNVSDMQQPQNYPSYISSYEQFYQQQQQQQAIGQLGNGGAGGGAGGSTGGGQHVHSGGIEYGNATANLYGNNVSNVNNSVFKAQSTSVRYHPYLSTPTSISAPSNETLQSNLPSVNSNAAVSTTTSISPRVGSSTSPTSTSTQMHLGAVGGNPQSPSSANCLSGQQLQCKKCGIMCTNESELQEHVTNVHGASPYGSSSGYSSSPYIKEELSSQQTPSSHGSVSSISGGASGNGNGNGNGNAGHGNPGDILDLDSQKMVYRSISGNMQPVMGSGHQMHQPHHQMHHEAGGNDPLHSMHNMQQRAMPNWDPSSAIPGAGSSAAMQEGLPPYMQPNDISNKSPLHAHQSPYYSPKQSTYHSTGNAVAGGAVSIKNDYPLIKSEYADSPNYVDKTFDPTGVAAGEICQQQQTSLPPQQPTMMPLSSSPAEFPSTTTGPTQEQQPQYRGFEPPTSSSILPANSLTAKAASWKSNEARRPKTYNCTACNKWFTSSGHLKRHYNTALHKNAVKSSGLPDPATLPISAHHHPARDPSSKHSRRNAASKQQQQTPAPVQPPESRRTPPDFSTGGGMGATTGMGQMSQYSSSPSPTQQQTMGNGAMTYGSQNSSQQNGFPQHQHQHQQQQQQSSYLPQVQSTSVSPQHAANNAVQSQQQQQQQQPNTVLNGHPNGLAGLSAPRTTPTPSSHTRGLLNIQTIITKNEVVEDNINNHQLLPMAMAMAMKPEPPAEMSVSQPASVMQMHHQQLPLEQLEALSLKEDVDYYQLPLGQHQLQLQLQLQQPLYHNSCTRSPPNSNSNSNNNNNHNHNYNHNQLHLPTITCPQERQQLVPQAPQVGNIFSQPLQPVHMQQQVSIPEAAFNLIRLGTNMPQPPNSNMRLLQLPQHINILTTANMDSIQQQQPIMLHPQLPEEPQQQQPEQHSTRSNTTNMLDIINTMPPLQHSTNSTHPSYQHQESALPPMDLPMTYHTIIGRTNGRNNDLNRSDSTNTCSEFLQLTPSDPYGASSQRPTRSVPQLMQQIGEVRSQVFSTTDGEILHFNVPNNSATSLTGRQLFGQPVFALPTFATVADTNIPSYQFFATESSPLEADLPPTSSLASDVLASTATQETHELVRDFANIAIYGETGVNENDGKFNMIHMPNKKTVAKRKTAKRTLNQPQANQQTRKTRKPAAKKAVNVPSHGTAAAGNDAEVMSRNTVTVYNKKSTKVYQLPEGSRLLANGRIQCLRCDKNFAQLCYLTQHSACSHAGEYPFRCKKCGKRFQFEPLYLKHKDRHASTDKPEKCVQCPKQFHHKTDLRRHIEGTHNGVKPHVCEICQKGFCRKDHLLKHVETHSRPRNRSRKIKLKKAASDASADN